jgi:hypothetical protein
MLGFLKRLLFGFDRSEKATDRIGNALEGLADDLEEVRAAVRRRLGLDEVSLPSPAIVDRGADVPAETPHKGGRKAKAAAS